VGCAPLGRLHGFSDFGDGQELRLDIDPAVQPDVEGTMTEMSVVELAEFLRVLKDDGIVLITCPDVQSVGAPVAQGELAYRFGFTRQLLADTVQACGFARTAGVARLATFDLWILGTQKPMPDNVVRVLAQKHLPV